MKNWQKIKKKLKVADVHEVTGNYNISCKYDIPVSCTVCTTVRRKWNMFKNKYKFNNVLDCN